MSAPGSTARKFHSDACTSWERYTLIDRDVLSYEATIEIQSGFRVPWKIKLPLVSSCRDGARR